MVYAVHQNLPITPHHRNLDTKMLSREITIRTIHFLQVPAEHRTSTLLPAWRGRRACCGPATSKGDAWVPAGDVALATEWNTGRHPCTYFISDCGPGNQNAMERGNVTPRVNKWTQWSVLSQPEREIHVSAVVSRGLLIYVETQRNLSVFRRFWTCYILQPYLNPMYPCDVLCVVRCGRVFPLPSRCWLTTT